MSKPEFIANAAVTVVGVAASVGVAVIVLRRTVASDRELAGIQLRSAISVPAARQLGSALSEAQQVSRVGATKDYVAHPRQALLQLLAMTRRWSSSYEQARLTIDVDGGVPFVIDSVSVICRMLDEPANCTYLIESRRVRAEQLEKAGLVYAALLTTLDAPLYDLAWYGSELLRWDGTGDLPRLEAHPVGPEEFKPLSRMWFEDTLSYPAGRPVDSSHPKMWMSWQLNRFADALWKVEQTQSRFAYYKSEEWERSEELRRWFEPDTEDALPAVEIPPPDIPVTGHI